MDNLISRQDALDAIDRVTESYNSADALKICAETRLELLTLPSAEPKKGKWKRLVLGTKEFGTTVMYRCSECEELSISQYFFCPHCGAKMGVME